MRINRNIAANYAARLWAGISTFIFVPAYLRILGPEAFGLVTFGTSLLGIVFVLDMGMSNTFAREMAREPDRQRLADLLRSLEWVYAGIILLVLFIAFSASGLIADHWLNVARLTEGQVRLSVGLMMISAVLQVMMSLYIGGLLGSNRHVAAASYQIGFSLVRSGLVLLPLYFYPIAQLFFAWQLVASLVALLLLRRTVWHAIDAAEQPRFSRPGLRAVRSFASGMFGIALISAINTQSDKIVVSKIFSLEQLGLYSVASLIGQVPSMLALPLAVTVLPRLTGHVARAEHSDLVAVYMRYSFMIATAAYTAAIGVTLAAYPLLTLIRGGAPTPELVATSRLLALGGALLAAQYMPYHLAVASGHTRTNFLFGCISAALLPFAMFAGALHIGLLGAAIPWVAMNAIAAVFLAWQIIPRFLGPYTIEWTLKANLLPATVSAMTIWPAQSAVDATVHPFAAIVLSGPLCAIAVALNAFLLFQIFPSSITRPPRQIEIR